MKLPMIKSEIIDLKSAMSDVTKNSLDQTKHIERLNKQLYDLQMAEKDNSRRNTEVIKQK
jgi:hypothetical protein